jgi:hypothetical protein
MTWFILITLTATLFCTCVWWTITGAPLPAVASVVVWVSGGAFALYLLAVGAVYVGLWLDSVRRDVRFMKMYEATVLFKVALFGPQYRGLTGRELLRLIRETKQARMKEELDALSVVSAE